MNKINNHRALLQKLIDQTITQEERWQLQRASLEDPFLADAIEGYTLQDHDQNDVTTLLAKTKHKTSKTRKLWPRMTVAACVVSLLTVSFWLLQSYDSGTKVSIAKAQNTDKRSMPQPQIFAETAAETKKNKTTNLESTAKKEVIPPTVPPNIATPIKSPMVKTSPVVEVADIEEIVVPMQEESAPILAKKSTTAVEEESEATNDLAADDLLMDPRRLGNMALPEDRDMAVQESKVTAAKRVYKTTSKKAKTSQPSSVLDKDADRSFQMKVTDEGLAPLAGVQILDLDQNVLSISDDSGYSYIPAEHAYVIAALSGYDTLTLANQPQLSVQLKKSVESSAQPHKRLVDLMSDMEVTSYYTNKLNERFSTLWPLCDKRTEESRLRNNISMNITISEFGKIDDLTYFSPIDSQCQERIEELLQDIAAAGVFYSGRAIQFRYRINI